MVIMKVVYSGNQKNALALTTCGKVDYGVSVQPGGFKVKKASQCHVFSN